MRSDTQSHSPSRVFITGMFDMMNFGDLMFPLIAHQRLGKLGIDVVPVSPTGLATGLDDAMASIGLQELLAGETPAGGMLIGGGYIIHNHVMSFLDQYRVGGLENILGPGLWLGATLAAAIRNIPVVWNAPGVPHPLVQSQRILIDAALRSADYLSVRDRGAAELLRAPGDVEFEIVPDTVVEISRLWSRQSLEAPFRSFIARKGGEPDARYFALHFRDRSIAQLGADGAAALIDEFAKTRQLVPILIAIGQAHADDAVARDIARHLKSGHIVLDDPSSLVEIAAAIGQSSLYVGASLHGYIVAAAYGVPGVLVARPSYRKFQGFLDHTGRHEDLARDWHQAFDKAVHVLDEGISVRVPESVFQKLDEHWKKVGAAFSEPEKKSRQRHDFLQDWFRAGVATGGPAWAHQPFVGRGTVRYSRGEP
jgi:polysaccharide pyruvyl transferase WcaK-like protein